MTLGFKSGIKQRFSDFNLIIQMPSCFTARILLQDAHVLWAVVEQHVTKIRIHVLDLAERIVRAVEAVRARMASIKFIDALRELVLILMDIVQNLAIHASFLIEFIEHRREQSQVVIDRAAHGIFGLIPMPTFK